MTFIDIRDRYGITQLVVEEHSDAAVRETAAKLGREYVIQASGKVIQRASKNAKIPTGEIEVAVDTLRILNASLTPPFTIEDNSDGGDELRMKYRFLDLRRNPLKKALILRHQMAHEVRNFLDSKGFLEIETPYLIKSTPEGARDFVVPSRMNAGEFYALPQSPQTFKQLLMVAGYDRYFQIVRCFRDEDLRADRQPEFTQIDCEMSFVDREDILTTFEGLAKHLFRSILGKTFEGDFPRITWHEAMAKYGSDKPDIRFGMTFNDITKLAQGKGFGVFDSAEYIGAICAEGCAGYTRKQLDALTEFVKKPQIGAKGMVYVRCEADGSYKSSVDKFYSQEDLAQWAAACGAKAGDLLLILSGVRKNTLSALCELRLEMGRLNPYFRRRLAGEDVQGARLLQGGGRKAVRIPDQCFQIRRTSTRWNRIRVRSLVCPVRRSRFDPRLHCLPEKQLGPRRDDRVPLDDLRCPTRRVIPESRNERVVTLVKYYSKTKTSRRVLSFRDIFM